MILNMTGGAVLRSIIAVTYPAGSVCTCTDGEKTLTARDTSGEALFNVGLGTWTVGITDAAHQTPVTKTVTVSRVGQSVSVTLNYELYLYNNGSTGYTWQAERTNWANSGQGAWPASDFTEGNGELKYTVTGYASGAFRTADKIDLTGRSIITAIGNLTKNKATYLGYMYLAVWEETAADVAASYELSRTEGDFNVSLDVSSLTGSYYVGFRCKGGNNIGIGLRVSTVHCE